MQYKGLRYINNAFKVFAERHQMLNGYKFAPYDDGIFDNKQFPLIYFAPETVGIEPGEETITLQMWVLDQDRGNTNEILADTLPILHDFKAYYYDCRGNEEGLEIVDSQTIEPISLDYEGVLTGWETSIQVRVPYKFDRAVIPMEIIKDADFTANVFGKYRVKTGANDVTVTSPKGAINGDVFTIIPDDEDGNNTLYVDGQDIGAQHGESIVFRYNIDKWVKL